MGTLGMSEGAAHTRLEVGRALGETFLGVGRQPLALAGLGFLGAGLLQLLIPGMVRGIPITSPVIGFFFGYGLGLAAQALTQPPMLAIAVGALTGRPASAAEWLRVTVRWAAPMLALIVLMTLGILAGLALLVVPGLILLLAWYVAPAAMVCERIGLVAALRRSAELTRGNRWRLLGALLLLILIVLAICFGAGLALGVPLAFAQLGGADVRAVLPFINALYGTIAAVLGATFQAAVYMQLRHVKEGAGADGVAAVFD